MKSALLLAPILLVGAVAPARAADERVLIALVDNRGSPQLVTRLEAELSAVGFRVARVSARAREPLATVAARSGAVAAVAVRRGDSGIELWGEHPDSGAPAFSELVYVDARRGKDIAAVTAVETLRGRLLLIGVTPETLRTELAPPPPVQAPPPPPPPPPPEPEPPLGFGLFFAGGVGSGTESVLSSGFVRVGLHVEPLPMLSIGLTANWQPFTESLVEPEGRASVRVGYATLGVDYVLEREPFSASFGPGFALVLVDLEGRASGDYRGQHDPVLTTAALGHTAFAWRVLGPLHLRADAELGVAFPRVVVEFAEREVATWGRPFVLASLGADLRF